MKDYDEPKTILEGIWGGACVGTTALAWLPIALGWALVKKMDGDEFGSAFEDAVDTAVGETMSFGIKHHRTLNSIAVSLVVGQITGSHPNNTPPPNT